MGGVDEWWLIVGKNALDEIAYGACFYGTCLANFLVVFQIFFVIIFSYVILNERCSV